MTKRASLDTRATDTLAERATVVEQLRVAFKAHGFDVSRFTDDAITAAVLSGSPSTTEGRARLAEAFERSGGVAFRPARGR